MRETHIHEITVYGAQLARLKSDFLIHGTIEALIAGRRTCREEQRQEEGRDGAG